MRPLFVAMLMGLGMMAAPAFAGTLDEIRARDRLVVGVKVDYVPLGFLDQAGQHAGIEIELARFIAERILGDPGKVEFVAVVFKNRVELLLANRIDMILATMVTTPERLKIVDASLPYLRPGGATLMAPKDGPVTSWETTRGQTLCGLEASYFNATIVSRFSARMVEFPDAVSAYQALADGRCAGFAFDEILLRLKVKDPLWSRYRIVGEPLQFNGFQIGVRKNDEAFLAALDRIVLQAQSEGRIVAWERRFGLDPDSWSVEQVDVARGRVDR